MTLPVPVRLALRELRGGLAGFGVFLACLALGVAAIAAVGSVRQAIEQGLSNEAAALLGGDAEMEFTYRLASDDERAWMDANAERVAETVDFRSMVAFTPEGGETERALVQVKAVDGSWPLYGEAVLGDGDIGTALLETGGLPGLVAQRILIDRLDLEIGDVLRLGEQDFRLTDELVVEPDGAASGFGLGPRVIVLRTALAESGLLSEGSLYELEYKLAFTPDSDLEALKIDAEARFSDTGLRWRDTRDGAPGVSRFVDRLGSFLVLIGLAGLAVGGVGVSAAVRAYLEGKTETIATLKTLGATGSTVFATYLVQIGLLSLVGVGIGLVLGRDRSADRGAVHRRPAAGAGGVRRICRAADRGRDLRAADRADLHGLAAGAGARHPGGGAVPRSDRGPTQPAPSGLYRARRWDSWRLLIGVATWLSGATMLALSTAAGIIIALGILLVAARGLRAAARRLARGPLTRGRPALRWALAALGGPSGETASVVLSLGLGLTVLATVGQIDSNLRNLITSDLPERAPAYFFLDIQNDQLPGFLERAEAVPGVEDIETAPMLRGIVTRINDAPATEVAGEHWVVRGDRGITYSQDVPEGVRLTAGEWWAPDYDGPPLMSFAEEEAVEIGLQLGDTVTVNILGRDITATIASFREVEFQNMGINFVMLMNPAALQGAPHTHIATVYAESDAEAPLLRDIAEAYPNITAVRVREAIERVAELLEGLSAATRWGAAATLLTGLVVLIGAAAAGERRRVFEAAVLKTLGASRARILSSFALRSALIGAAAGAVAILGGAIAGWWVTEVVMDGTYRFEPVSAFAIVIGGALASLLAGLAFALRPLAAKPAGILRARE